MLLRPALLALASTVALLACGHDPAPTKPATPAAPSRTVTRGASEALQQRWPIDAASAVAYLDMGAFGATELGRSLAPRLLEAVGKGLSPASRACAALVLGAARELAFAVGEHGPFVVVRHEPLARDPGECFSADVTEANRAVIAGAKHAIGLGDGVVAFEPGFVYFGRAEDVTAALARTGRAWPAALTLAGDQSGVFVLKGDLVEGTGHLVSNAALFRLDLDGTTQDERVATSLEREAKALRAEGGRSPLTAMIGQHVEVTRSGKDVKLAFVLAAPPAEQVSQLGRLAELGQAMLEEYLAQQKLAEVEAGLQWLVRAYGVDFDARAEKTAKSAKGKPKLVSYPPIPKEVPRGTAIVLTEADRKPWADLGIPFASTRFQYEVKAAKDGRSAELVAHGDLDGNGKVSTFRILAQLDGDKLVVNPNVEETDPLE